MNRMQSPNTGPGGEQSGNAKPLRSPIAPPSIKVFMEHLKTCDICSQVPFTPCEIGKPLLSVAATGCRGYLSQISHGGRLN